MTIAILCALLLAVAVLETEVAVEGLQGPSAVKAAHRIPAPIVRICGMEVTKGETY